MNLILLGLGVVLAILGVFSGSSVNVASIIARFKRDKDAEIKNTVNDSKIATTSETESKLQEQEKSLSKSEEGKTKDEILKFWNKK